MVDIYAVKNPRTKQTSRRTMQQLLNTTGARNSVQLKFVGQQLIFNKKASVTQTLDFDGMQSEAVDMADLENPHTQTNQTDNGLEGGDYKANDSNFKDIENDYQDIVKFD